MSMRERTIRVPFALDLHRSMLPLRLGKHDPTVHLRPNAMIRSARTPEGPSTLRVHQREDHLHVEAWGDGADWALEMAPSTLGLLDEHAGFDPDHPLVRTLHRRSPGLRLPTTGRVLDALIPAVLAQRVTGFEAKRSYRLLVEKWGEPAPGPGELMLAPPPDAITELGYYELHVIGVEKRRADALQRVCAHASRLDAAGTAPVGELHTRLRAIPGVGQWTAAEVARVSHGDADAVSVGDYHLKNLVSFALADEPRGTDERMLELLEPFRGHRGRVCLLLEGSGIAPPRYGPRRPIEPVASR